MKNKLSLWEKFKDRWINPPRAYHRLEVEAWYEPESQTVNVKARCTNIWCLFKISHLEKMQTIDWEKLSRDCMEGDGEFIPPDLSKLGGFSVIRNIPWMK